MNVAAMMQSLVAAVTVDGRVAAHGGSRRHHHLRHRGAVVGNIGAAEMDRGIAVAVAPVASRWGDVDSTVLAMTSGGGSCEPPPPVAPFLEDAVVASCFCCGTHYGIVVLS